jgi:hypothetical protein
LVFPQSALPVVQERAHNDATVTVISNFEQIQGIRHNLFHFRPRDLLRGPISQLSAFHVLAGC